MKGETTLKSTKDDRVRLNKREQATLKSLEPLVQGIAEAFGTNCEVVLHSLEDLSHSVVKIVNGHVTGRNVGSPLTDFGLEILEKADLSKKGVAGSYYSRLDDGRLLKSVTMLIRNTHGKAIGMMCINIDLSVPFLDFMREFVPAGGESAEKMVEHFPSTVNELVSTTLETVITGVNNQREISPSAKNRAIVTELYRRGMFKITGVIDIIAKKMGISRYTVYNYIREAKVEAREEV